MRSNSPGLGKCTKAIVGTASEPSHSKAQDLERTACLPVTHPFPQALDPCTGQDPCPASTSHRLLRGCHVFQLRLRGLRPSARMGQRHWVIGTCPPGVGRGGPAEVSGARTPAGRLWGPARHELGSWADTFIPPSSRPRPPWRSEGRLLGGSGMESPAGHAIA